MGTFAADGSYNVTIVSGGGSGGGGTANPNPGTDYAKDTKQPTLVNGRTPVDGSGVTQPVSGTFWQATQPISATSLPLATGAATSANQTSELTKLDTLHTDLIAPTPAGTNVIGGVTLPKVAGSPATARGTVTTGTTQSLMLAAGRTDEMACLKNTGTVKVYIGNAGVTAANGWPLAVGESMTMDAKIANGAVYAVLDTAQTTAGEIAVWRF